MTAAPADNEEWSVGAATANVSPIMSRELESSQYYVRSLSVNLVDVSNVDSLQQVLRGLASVGVHEYVLPWSLLEEAGIALVHDLLEETSSRLRSIIVPSFFNLADRAQSDHDDARLRAAIDAAVVLDCSTIYGTTGPRGDLTFGQASALFGELVRQHAEYARQRNIRVLIESTNALRVDINFVFTLRDLADVAKEARIGMCVDLAACWTERDVNETLAGMAPSVDIVQIADFVPGTRTTGDRAVPGDGVIPLKALLSSLLEGGFQGVFDLELLGPRLVDEGLVKALARGWHVANRVIDESRQEAMTA